jgi:hypothetical protein
MLERGIDIGSIECLVESRTVSSAVTLPLRLRYVNLLVPCLFALWALSPLGGQAAIRVVSQELVYTNGSSQFTYLDVNSSEFTINGASSRSENRGAINSNFKAALISPSSFKGGSQDIFGNLKVPMMEAVSGAQVPDANGWYHPDDNKTDVYSALLGLPMLGVPGDGNATFRVESSYMFPNCTVSRSNITGDYPNLAAYL